jgi:hypothetical protein
MRERDVERDPAAQGETDECRPLDSERVEYGNDVVLPRPRHRRAGGTAEEAEIGANRAEPLGEHRNHGLPQPRVAEPAVQQEHGFALSGLVVPETGAVDLGRGHSATL